MNFLKFYLHYDYSFLSSIWREKEPLNHRKISYIFWDYLIFLDNPKDDIYFPFTKINTINSQTIVDIFNEIPENLYCSRIVINYNKDNCNLDLSDFNLVSNKNNLDSSKLNIVKVSQDVYQLLPLKDQNKFIKIWDFFERCLSTNSIGNAFFDLELPSSSNTSTQETFNIYIVGCKSSIIETVIPQSFFHLKNIKELCTSLIKFEKLLYHSLLTRYALFIKLRSIKEDRLLLLKQVDYISRIIMNYLRKVLFIFPVHPFYTLQLFDFEIRFFFSGGFPNDDFVKLLHYYRKVPLTSEWLKYYIKRSILNNILKKDLKSSYHFAIVYNSSNNNINWSDFKRIVIANNATSGAFYYYVKVDDTTFFLHFLDEVLENFFSSTRLDFDNMKSYFLLENQSDNLKVDIIN